VADFIGRVNFIDGKLTRVGEDTIGFTTTDFGDVDIPWQGSGNSDTILAIRPEHVSVSNEPPADAQQPHAKGRVIGTTYYGDSRQVFVRTEGNQEICATLRNETADGPRVGSGDTVWLSWQPENCRPLNAID
jgi:ABC-type Fe3+/spermidine/putrescine transport system ATPase subunit